MEEAFGYLQAGENEGESDCVRCPRRWPGYYRGDGRASRGDGTRVAVGMAEIQAELRGNRSRWQRERGKAQEGAEGGAGGDSW